MTPETWTQERVGGVMMDEAAQSGGSWGVHIFDLIRIALDADVTPELQTWAIAVADGVTLDLIAASERLADDLCLSPDDRRRLIEERVGACRVELFTRIAVDSAGRQP